MSFDNAFLAQRLVEAGQAKARRAEERQRLWQDIQQQAPDLAVFMVGLKQAFGKVELVEVRFYG